MKRSVCVKENVIWTIYFCFVFLSKSTAEEEIRRTAADLLRSGAQRKLIDFDNHLDNVKNDWRNPELSELISTYV